MAKLSTARKASILAEIVGRRLEGVRAFSAMANAGRATARQLGRVLGQLWLEVTGFVFLALAAMGAIALVREYSKFQAGKTTGSRVAIAVCFTVVFGWFGLSSFWRVRRKG